MSPKSFIFFAVVVLVVYLTNFNAEAGLSQSKPQLPKRPEIPCNERETADCKKNCSPFEITCKAQILETGERSFFCQCVGVPEGYIAGEARK